MVRRIITAVIVFVVCAVLLIPILAPDTHALLMQDFSLLTWNPWVGWQMIWDDARVRQFYFYYCVGLIMLLVWALVSGNYLKYRSDMQEITPDIETPRPDGQGQYGTARWMNEKKIGKYFTAWKVPKRTDWFKDMMAAGKADYEEIENAKIEIQTSEE